MKRFTSRQPNGGKGLVFNNSVEFSDKWYIGTRANGSCVVMGDAIDRFFAYEDLGLEPSQIAEIDRLYQLKCEEVVALKKEVAEYQQKIADGRMVELPCNYNDTLYWISKGKIEEVWFKGIRCDKGYKPQILARHMVGLGTKEEPITKIENIGKTIFLTREEAHKALKEINHNQNENPCINSGCDCYNSEVGGCEMPSEDLMFACPLERGDK